MGEIEFKIQNSKFKIIGLILVQIQIHAHATSLPHQNVHAPRQGAIPLQDDLRPVGGQQSAVGSQQSAVSSQQSAVSSLPNYN